MIPIRDHFFYFILYILRKKMDNNNWLLDLASYTLEQKINEKIETIENTFINKNYKSNFEIKFSNNISNQFKIGNLLFQLRIENNIVKLYGNDKNIYTGSLHDKKCNNFITDLFFILSSQEIKTVYKYELGNYYCSRFSPQQLSKYINSNISSFYKVILDNPDLFPNGVKKSKFDNGLIVNTENGGFIKFYLHSEDKPIIVLDPIKKAKQLLKSYLQSKIMELNNYINLLNNQLIGMKQENKYHLEIKKKDIQNKINQVDKSLNFDSENQEIINIKKIYHQKRIDEVNKFTNEYCIENSILISLLPYDNNYLLAIQNLQSKIELEKFTAIRKIEEIKNYKEKKINFIIYGLEQEYQHFKQDLINNEVRLKNKIEKYLKKVKELIDIDLSNIFKNLESKIKSNQYILTITLEQSKSLKYRNNDHQIKKLSNNQLNRSLNRTIKQLIEGDHPRQLRLIGNVEDIDHIVNVAKINRDDDHFPYILSSKLSDTDYKNFNNQWLHDLNLTLVEIK